MTTPTLRLGAITCWEPVRRGPLVVRQIVTARREELVDTPARRHTTRVARGRRTAGQRANNRDVASLRAESQLDTGVYFESRSASFIEAIIKSKYSIRLDFDAIGVSS